MYLLAGLAPTFAAPELQQFSAEFCAVLGLKTGFADIKEAKAIFADMHLKEIALSMKQAKALLISLQTQFPEEGQSFLDAAIIFYPDSRGSRTGRFYKPVNVVLEDPSRTMDQDPTEHGRRKSFFRSTPPDTQTAAGSQRPAGSCGARPGWLG